MEMENGEDGRKSEQRERRPHAADSLRPRRLVPASPLLSPSSSRPGDRTHILSPRPASLQLFSLHSREREREREQPQPPLFFNSVSSYLAQRGALEAARLRVHHRVADRLGARGRAAEGREDLDACRERERGEVR